MYNTIVQKCQIMMFETRFQTIFWMVMNIQIKKSPLMMENIS